MNRYRFRDIVASALGLVVLSPLLLLVAAGIKLDSRGPVLYRQERVGLNGALFRIHKFRSMHPGKGPSVSTSDDPRVTRFGRILRWSKIDELPQLYDVLVGNMSLVGPRPEIPEFAEHWPRYARATILSVRPGITDPASITFRDEASFLATSADPQKLYLEAVIPQKVELYVRYVSERTFFGDLRIILSTFDAIFFVRRKGAE